MTDEILHVHHWHRKKICCQEHPPSTDLPDIECCCRCNQEREIIKTEMICPKCNFSQSFCKCAKLQEARNLIDSLPERDDPRQKSLDRLRKQEQKREFEGADATLRAYHARKAKKNFGPSDDTYDRHNRKV